MNKEIAYTVAELTDDDLRGREQEIRNMLWEHQCEVTFTKVNGESRTMPCTLMPSALPQREASKLHETRIYNPKNMSVWCLDKSEWRSFRTANVTQIKVIV